MKQRLQLLIVSDPVVFPCELRTSDRTDRKLDRLCGVPMSAQMLTLTPNYPSQPAYPSMDMALSVPTALICDNALLRSGLQQILSGTPIAIAEAVSVTGPGRFQAVTPDTALALVEATQNPGRVLEIVREVRDQAPGARIVVLVDQYDLDFLKLGFEAGVNGFCLTSSSPDVLIRNLEMVMLGQSVLPFEIMRAIMGYDPQAREQSLRITKLERRVPALTPGKLSLKEVQVLSYLRDGASNKVIARNLEIAEATVKVHVKSILRKMGVKNRTQAALWASQSLPQESASIPNV